MKTLVIYDDVGKIFSLITGDYLIPQGGVQYLETEVPEGKRIKLDENGIGVDVSVIPHKVILENIPKTDIQILKERQDATENALLDLLLGGM